ncbi:hypothetical protein ABPG74_009396 [Tetrahymena malaccensis]
MNENNQKKIYFNVNLNLREPQQPKYPSLNSKNKKRVQKDLKTYHKQNEEYLKNVIKYQTKLNVFYSEIFSQYNELEYETLKDLSQFDQSQANLNVCFWLSCDELTCSVDYRNLFHQMKCPTPQQKTQCLDNFKYQQKVYNKSQQLSLRIIKDNELFSIKQNKGTKLILFHFIALQKKKKTRKTIDSEDSFDSQYFTPSDSLNSKRQRFQEDDEEEEYNEDNEEDEEDEEDGEGSGEDKEENDKDKEEDDNGEEEDGEKEEKNDQQEDQEDQEQEEEDEKEKEKIQKEQQIFFDQQNISGVNIFDSLKTNTPEKSIDDKILIQQENSLSKKNIDSSIQGDQNSSTQLIQIEDLENINFQKCQNQDQNFKQLIQEHTLFLQNYVNQNQQYFKKFNNHKSMFSDTQLQNLLDQQKQQLLDFIIDMLQYQKQKIYQKYPDLQNN